MTGEVVSLRRARKRKMREAAGVVAAANRVSHGLSRDVRLQASAEREHGERHLDAHRLDPIPTTRDDA